MYPQQNPDRAPLWRYTTSRMAINRNTVELLISNRSFKGAKRGWRSIDIWVYYCVKWEDFDKYKNFNLNDLRGEGCVDEKCEVQHPEQNATSSEKTGASRRTGHCPLSCLIFSSCALIRALSERATEITNACFTWWDFTTTQGSRLSTLSTCKIVRPKSGALLPILVKFTLWASFWYHIVLLILRTRTLDQCLQPIIQVLSQVSVIRCFRVK